MKTSTRYPLWLGLQFIGLPGLLFLMFGGSFAQLSGATQRLVGVVAIAALGLIGSGLVLAKQLQGKQRQLIVTQEEFIAHASHELKTPIAAQRALLDVSKDDVPPVSVKEWRSFIDRVLVQNSRLDRLSGQLIRLNIDRADSASEMIDARKTIKQAVTNVLPLAHSKHIGIDTDIAALRAKVHPDDLRDVLVIVLDNAIKFSPERTTVTVTGSTHNKHIMITIQDQGVGMNRQDIKRAFEPFYRAKTALVPGSGLGLAIAAKLAKRNNATITIESKPSKGTIVTISLPTVQ